MHGEVRVPVVTSNLRAKPRHRQLTKRYRFPASLLGRWVMLLGVQPPIKKTVPIRELVGAEGQHMFMRALHTDGKQLRGASCCVLYSQSVSHLLALTLSPSWCPCVCVAQM